MQDKNRKLYYQTGIGFFVVLLEVPEIKNRNVSSRSFKNRTEKPNPGKIPGLGLT